MKYIQRCKENNHESESAYPLVWCPVNGCYSLMGADLNVRNYTAEGDHIND